MELLSPVGNFDKLRIALTYGADAVYFGGKGASLRASTAEFAIEDLSPAIEYVHSQNKKAYITVNIFPHNNDLGYLKEYIQEVAPANPDGFILSDLGVFSLCQKYAPNVPIHISTQANNVNFESATKWHEMGAQRIILARELTLDEIKEYRENTPPTLELELFIHGAMCMGYSGRCLVSNYLTGRDANCGSCAQPCRWEYKVIHNSSSIINHSSLTLTNNNTPIEIEETPNGTFFLNSKDMCLIQHIGQLAKIGIDSIKIEGRNKSEYYVAATTKAYRGAIDDYNVGNPFNEELLAELEKVSHRPYIYNFGELSQVYGSSSYIRSKEVVAIVTSHTTKKKKLALANFNNTYSLFTIHYYLIFCFQRGKIISGEPLEILTPTGFNIRLEKAEIFDPITLEPLDSTPHPEMPFYLKSPVPIPVDSFIRKQI